MLPLTAAPSTPPLVAEKVTQFSVFLTLPLGNSRGHLGENLNFIIVNLLFLSGFVSDFRYVIKMCSSVGD